MKSLKPSSTSLFSKYQQFNGLSRQICPFSKHCPLHRWHLYGQAAPDVHLVATGAAWMTGGSTKMHEFVSDKVENSAKPSLNPINCIAKKRFKLWIRSWGCSLGSISWILEYSGYIALGQIGFKWLVFIYGYNVFKWLQWYNGGIGNTFTLVPVRWFQASLYQWRHPFTMGPILDGFFWVLSFGHPWPI